MHWKNCVGICSTLCNPSHLHHFLSFSSPSTIAIQHSSGVASSPHINIPPPPTPQSRSASPLTYARACPQPCPPVCATPSQWRGRVAPSPLSSLVRRIWPLRHKSPVKSAPQSIDDAYIHDMLAVMLAHRHDASMTYNMPLASIAIAGTWAPPLILSSWARQGLYKLEWRQELGRCEAVRLPPLLLESGMVLPKRTVSGRSVGRG